MATKTNGTTIPLSRTTKFIVDNRGRTAPTAEAGVALIATNCISNGRLYPSYESVRYVSHDTYETWFRAHPKPGDIILTLKGSQNGAVCLVPDPVDFAIAQDMVALRADETVIDPLYLFAALRSHDAQRQIKNLDVSGIIPHFKKTDFDKLLLPYPDRPAQEVIGRSYFHFSARIELNRSMNETLEAMARAVFRSWFVDFDPVRSKAEGRTPYGMDAATAKLFPDKFEDSLLGPVPKGWRVGQFNEIATLSRDGINPGDFPTEVFDHYSIPAFDDGRQAKKEIGEAIKSNKFVVKPEAVLLSKLNPRIERVWLPFPDNKYRGVCSTEFLVLCAKAPFSREFVAELVSSAPFQEVFVTLVTGTSGSHQRVQPDSLMGMDWVIPEKEVVERFTRLIQPIQARIAGNTKESVALAATRDTLLPKLLSGEVSVPDAEQNLGRAT